MSQAQYHEKINRDLIKELIKNEVESSMLKENVSNFDASNVLAENIIQENEHEIKIFMNTYNKTVDNLFTSIKFIENMDEDLIENVFTKNDNLHIELDINNLDLIMIESPINIANKKNKEMLERAAPEVTVMQNNEVLFHSKNNFYNGVEYKYNPKVLGLPAYKIGNHEHLTENAESKNQVFDEKQKIRKSFKEESSKSLVQAILHEQIILPLESFMKNYKEVNLKFFKENKNAIIIPFMFEEYKKEVGKLLSEKNPDPDKTFKPLKNLIKKDQYSKDFISKYNKRLKKVSEALDGKKEENSPLLISEEYKAQRTIKRSFGLTRK